DMGAEVIKVENPQGDIMRRMGVSRNKAMGPIHLSVNRNKKSVMLDLRTPAGREVLLRLLRDADVLVHSMRPAAMERLGLGYAQVQQHNANIIYCGAYGFGTDGPYADDPAYDDIIQGLCGLTSINAQLAGEPRFTPTIIGDKVAGLAIAHSVLAALFHKARTGEGQSIEVPMLETLTSFMLVEHLGGRVFDIEQGTPGYERVLSQLRKPHRTKDGYVCVLPYTDKNWQDFFEQAGRPEIAQDPRYATASSRSGNYETLYKVLGDIMAEQSTDEWLNRLKPLSIPIARVNSLDDLFTDPHLNAVGMFCQKEHDSEGTLTQVRPPVKFDKTPCDIHSLAPRLGQHSREVLAAAGYSDQDIDTLIADGVTC
ncbi:MAG TPA: CoA transferase, partial [Burkholderiaceae bacterium]|nr:CoA transferase [Burkholderiaceae bacterium]